jgi:hypothetical protein
MLHPPFLELQYYVGSHAETVMKLLAKGNPHTATQRKLAVPRLVGLSDDPEELENYGRIVALRTEGDAFCGEEREALGRLRRLGRLVYKRFLEVAEMVPCIYGAILVEYSLEEPEALRTDPRSLAFRNFYLKHACVSNQVLDDITQLAGTNGYIEKLEQGTYVSMSAEFNPAGRGIDPIESQERSVEIASVLANSIR